MSTMRANRYAAAATARATLAKIVLYIASAVALVLILGIVLVLLGANNSNELVQWVRDAAGFLAGPFDNLFNLDSRKTETAVNWGIAAVVWYLVGRLIYRLILRR
jgi:hypothetical protein